MVLSRSERPRKTQLGRRPHGGRTLADGFPDQEEGLQAWDKWVDLLTRRYQGKVRVWSVWNEPELRNPNQPDKIVDFTIRTAAFKSRSGWTPSPAAFMPSPPEKMGVEGDVLIFWDIPVYDAAAFITEKTLLDMTPSRH